MTDIPMTEAARRRAQRRGLRPTVVETVIDYADLEMPLRGNLVAIRLSRNAFIRVRNERGSTMADRSKNVVLILSGETVVTCLFAIGLPSRYYRKRHR